MGGDLGWPKSLANDVCRIASSYCTTNDCELVSKVKHMAKPAMCSTRQYE
jgi:hypothetical protein